MKTAVVYARYSSERQTEQSIEGQLRECNEYAMRNDIVIVDTYIDRAMTGTNDNRTDFQRLLKDCSKHAWDYVLVYKLDRFSRNKYEMAMHKKTLRDNGIKLISVKENIPDSPEGIILESLLEGMAEYYSAELSQKVRRGMREGRIKGHFAGGAVLYGYKVINKKIFVDENTSQIVIRIFQEFAAGKFVKDIIADLTNEGIYHNGKPLGRNTVYKLLRNEKYIGIVRYGNEVFTNIYPQIVPNTLFEVVQTKIDGNRYGKHDSDAIYILKGKMKCGYCGKTITSESGTGKSGKVKRYYKCFGRKNAGNGCQKETIRKETLESLIVDTTLKFFEDKLNLSFIADKILELHQKRVADTSVLNILLEEKASLTKSIDNILDAIAEGYRSSKTKEKLEEFEAKLDIVEGKILIEKAKEKSAISKEDIIKFISKCIKKEPLQMIKLLIKEIILFDDKVEIYYNYIDKKSPDEFEHQAFLFYEENVDLYMKDDYKLKERDYILNVLVQMYIWIVFSKNTIYLLCF